MLVPIAGLLLFIAGRFAMQLAPLPRRPVQRASAIPPPKPAPKPEKHRGTIVLILDDVGFDHQPLDAAMHIDPRINFSILPNARNATAFANELTANGFEVLCHLPMEPEGYPRISPGTNAVLTSMTDDEIARTTRDDIHAIPHARGVNNHMGSQATADRRVMSDVLHALPHGMYFIDSRTTPASLAETMARQMSIRTASRNVFLDDVATEPAIREQLRQLAHASETHGLAIGIGHMYPPTIAVLRAEVPRLRSEGYRFVRASEAVR